MNCRRLATAHFQRSHAQHRPGFTLVELMSVVVIIMLLVGLILPALYNSRATARKVLCINRLHNLGIAYIQRVAVRGRPGELPWAGVWQAELDPYIENDAKNWVCPEGVLSNSSGVSSYCVKFFGLPRFNPVTGQPDSSTDQQAVVSLDPGNGACRMSYQPSYLTKKTTGNSYVLEVKAADWSQWYDYVLLVEPQADGVNVKLTCLNRGSYTVQFFKNSADAKAGTNAVGALANANGTATLPGTTNKVSFGMNSAVDLLGNGDSNKVVLLDYNNLVAHYYVRPSGAAGFTNAIDTWSTAVRPAHREQVNVLLNDGSVKTVFPTDIDPTVADAFLINWRPRDL